MGGIYRCGCKEVYRFPHIYLSLLLLYLLFFGSLKKMFFVLVPYFFVIKFYVLNIFSAQYKHTHWLLRASHGNHMKGCT